MKRKILLCLLLCCSLMLFVLAACADTPDDPTPTDPPDDTPPRRTTYEVDLADGNTGFLSLNLNALGADQAAQMQVATLDGASALKIEAPGGRSVHLGINVSGLLGDRAANVRTIIAEMYAEYPDGNFSAVSGKIEAFKGEARAFASNDWTIYLASRNPNPAVLEFATGTGFDAALPNLLEISCLKNGPADRGETPAVIWIKSITFFDSSNTAIEVDTEAGWAAPEGYGDPPQIFHFYLPFPPPHGDPGGWQQWYTPDVDGFADDYMPWETLAASLGIVFEMEEPTTFEVLYFGGFNGWAWTQTQVSDKWANGELAVTWLDIGFDPLSIQEAAKNDQAGSKIGFGNWELANVTGAYLVVDRALMP